MEAMPQKPQDIIDTTDSLEAIDACKSMKNFLFVVVLLCLLLTQLIFWMSDFGLIQCATCCPCVEQSITTGPAETCGCDTPPVPPAAAVLPLAATVDVAQGVEKVAGGLEQNAQQTEAAIDTKVIIEKEADAASAETPAGETSDQSQAKKFGLPFQIPCRWVMRVVSICNFLMLSCSILYCLTLLVCLKISLTGRLGGVNHIARAFFISLLLMVVLIPWQQVLPKVLVGTIWLPGELLCGGWAKAHGLMFWTVLYYIRFVGLWVVAMWFLLWAQIRSAKWARTTLRRLGIVR